VGDDEFLLAFLRERLREDRTALERAPADAGTAAGSAPPPWDPARMRRELEAKERVVAYYARLVEVSQRMTGDWVERSLWEVREVVRLLADAYGEHPDRPADVAQLMAGRPVQRR